MRIQLVPAIALAALLLAQGVLRASSPGDASDPMRMLNDRSAGVYEIAAPSVVLIEAKKSGRATGRTILPNGWEMFFQSPDDQPFDRSPNQGSGVIYRADGHILTNNHILEQTDPEAVEVTLHDSRKFPARVLARDPRTDLAVLKIDADKLPAARIGDSDLLRIGEFVFAIGAPMDLPYSLTFGILSAKGRSNLTRSTTYEDYLQTDAAINPGNSGGPLLNINGEVVGINTLISGLHRGIGFAIPINMASGIADQLIANGRVIRPWLGISIIGLRESDELRPVFPSLENGVVVQAVHPETPASLSELRAGDVILRVDDSPVAKAGDVQKAVLRRKVGDEVRVDVWRDGTILPIAIQTGELPASLP